MQVAANAIVPLYCPKSLGYMYMNLIYSLLPYREKYQSAHIIQFVLVIFVGLAPSAG